jgi:hypothetical protein
MEIQISANTHNQRRDNRKKNCCRAFLSKGRDSSSGYRWQLRPIRVAPQSSQICPDF